MVSFKAIPEPKYNRKEIGKEKMKKKLRVRLVQRKSMQTKAVAESRRDCGRGGIETVPALVCASKVFDDFFVLNAPSSSREHDVLQFLFAFLLPFF